MIDLGIDDEFNLEVTSRNDLNVVSEAELFHQELITRLTLYQREVLGDLNAPNAIRKVRKEVTDALNESDSVNTVQTVDVSKIGHNSIDVYVVFNRTETIDEII